ncbi:TetR/AcrR family transcriptional regulator [Mycobacterium talmoniae]|uniref:Putative HTH-type transcriptional regulator n=1 Tax=Mycobacterium talmoniae TaxID=1858794 RepID=A0A1S1N6N8_9MYCO|nr:MULTISPECIES: TetR/AcrR family transcriptional regulator [Mycobacterium]OHU95675.1 TetR family transcriptional regulator [Mycobacterium talmoniae]PQM46275.1 putative HTH-type transcriptional regulator [Mycobacterium talmoniae]TDH48166.1 TetR/AcrR family transcriptional regulator [Mycobacterium eburneum]
MSLSPRERLVEAGTRLLEQAGPEALQARKVAAEIGASTMAVYTHFGGMNGLLEAIVAAAFERFGAALASAPTTDDPMADFFVMGYAYREFALASPQRYRLMFGLAAPQQFHPDTAAMPVAAATFQQLVTAVERIVATGRIRADDAVDLAGRVWSMVHGVVLLELTGTFGHDGRALSHILGPMTVDLFVGMGDDRQNAERSLRRAGAAISAR